MNFADGQRRTCRLQIFTLPSANETFAIGKCLAGRRQNSYRINGKINFSHRQIFCLPSAIFFMGSTAAPLRRLFLHGRRLSLRRNKKNAAKAKTLQTAADCTVFCFAVSSINITSIRKQFPRTQRSHFSLLYKTKNCDILATYI